MVPFSLAELLTPVLQAIEEGRLIDVAVAFSTDEGEDIDHSITSPPGSTLGRIFEDVLRNIFEEMNRGAAAKLPPFRGRKKRKR